MLNTYLKVMTLINSNQSISNKVNLNYMNTSFTE